MAIPQFQEFDPDQLPSGGVLLARLPDLISVLENGNQKHREYYVIGYAGYLILGMQGDFHDLTTGEPCIVRHQIEIPLAGAAWFADAIDRRFALPESQGGLPRGQFFLREWVDGEHLSIHRGANLAELKGERIAGYTLWNISRLERTRPLGQWKQEFEFPDPMLFEGGCLQVFRDIAARHAKGEL